MMQHNHRGSETSAMPCPACAEPYYIERPVYQAAIDKIATLEDRVAALTKERDETVAYAEQLISAANLAAARLQDRVAALTKERDALANAPSPYLQRHLEQQIRDADTRAVALTNSTENWKQEALRATEVATKYMEQVAALTAALEEINALPAYADSWPHAYAICHAALDAAKEAP